MRIVLIAKPGDEDTGVGRYVSQLRDALEQQGHDVKIVHPIVPLPALLLNAIRRFLGWDLRAFFNNYPIWARYPQADIYHVTSQNLATLLILRRPPARTVVTVHDIFPWLLRDNIAYRIYEHRVATWFDRLALAGVRQADGLLTVSHYTKSTYQDYLSNANAIPTQ